MSSAEIGALLIAIDGPAGSGKSTVSRELARRLGAKTLDSGATYRALTARAIDFGLDLSDDDQISDLADRVVIAFERIDDFRDRVLVDRLDYTERIRSARINARVSEVAKLPKTRDRMRARWRAMFDRSGSMVVEGRDIATNVFPEADHAFYLTASLDERARRRRAEAPESSAEESLDDVAASIERRDRLDSSRSSAPLRKSDRAIEIDTSDLSIDEVVENMLSSIFPGGSRRPR